MTEPQEETYPLRGYVYSEDGYHTGGIELRNGPQTRTFLDTVARPAIRRGLEVRITDSDDFMVFHAVDGRIVWPTREIVEAHVAPGRDN